MKKELIFAFSGLALLLVGCSSSTDTGFKISTKSSSDKYPATEEVMVKKNDGDADLKDTLKINGHKKSTIDFSPDDSYEHDFSYIFTKKDKPQDVSITLTDKEDDSNKTTKKVIIPALKGKEISAKKNYTDSLKRNHSDFEKTMNAYLENKNLENDISASYRWDDDDGTVIFTMHLNGTDSKEDKSDAKEIKSELTDQTQKIAAVCDLKNAPYVELQDATGQTY